MFHGHRSKPSILGGIPVRDLWLLPGLSLLTLLIMSAGAELFARYYWQEQGNNTCRVPDDALGFRYRANCSSVMKSAEGPWYTNSYNECGYRSSAACGPLPPGSHRIALIGTSVGEGYLVDYPHSIGGSLESDLSRMCGARVEVQNLAAMGYNGRRLLIRMQEALALKPEAVLWVVSPFDLIEQDKDDPDQPDTLVERAPLRAAEMTLQERFLMLLKLSRAITIARSLLFENNPTLYAPLYIRNGDKADFLRPPFTAAWQERLRRFDRLVASLAERAHAAGVSLSLAFVPNQAQLDLVVMPGDLNVDPAALPRAMAAIAERYSVRFVDTTTVLRHVPKPGSLFYQVDGHPSGQGQSLIARGIAEHLTADTAGKFFHCGRAPEPDLTARE